MSKKPLILVTNDDGQARAKFGPELSSIFEVKKSLEKMVQNSRKSIPMKVAMQQ